MLRRLILKDFVIVAELELELAEGFTALTGETGAGKSILIDALQLALGQRGDAGVVREGAARTDISAEFDTPVSLQGWLDEAGFDTADTVLLRRVVDTQGKSRAWVNGSAATLAQLREAAEHLVDIHGQHAWQSLTRPAAVRQLLDEQAGSHTSEVAQAHGAWRQAEQRLAAARAQQALLLQERERLVWQIGELEKLSPAPGEWEDINTEHRRLSHAQALLDAARQALDALSEAEESASTLTARAVEGLSAVADHDPELAAVAQVLRDVQAQLDDAAHTLHAYGNHHEPDPDRLDTLDQRLGAWLSLARRYRRPPEELPGQLADWKQELQALDAAADLPALERAVGDARAAWQKAAARLTQQRTQAAPRLGKAVTQAMQQLGMAGGRFEVQLIAHDEPQAHGAEDVEFWVAGHAGSSPRPLAKVASGGELSRLALAIAATTAGAPANARTVAAPRAQGTPAAPATLIFDEIDAGVGGDVAHAVGRLMKQLGRGHQVMAVTHLAQVAACADHHWVVAKQRQGASTVSKVSAVQGESRVGELARMLGGGQLAAQTSRAHAQALLEAQR
ncbi:MAG: DNA repair protein RecN [Rubrivivax sp.]|nr:DNA repair protein RecN [Rubrivivax sp.]